MAMIHDLYKQFWRGRARRPAGPAGGAAPLWALLLLAAFRLYAGGDEVVVVYNSRVPESRQVAEHYAALRQVPTNQIFGFALTTNEIITRADFTDFLQQPLAAALVSAGLWQFGHIEVPAPGAGAVRSEERVVSSRIRYAVLCYGMPLKIAPSLLPDPLAATIARPELRSDAAAVDSELAWLPLLRMKVPLPGPLPNLLYACTNHERLSPVNGVLLVSRLDGPSPAIASQLVDKALAAEAKGLWGRAYFDLCNHATNDTYYLGDQWLARGAEVCRELGFDVEVDTNSATFSESFPMSHIAIYAGWYDSEVSGPFKLPAVEFMPGAFAYHLHSFSAETLRSAGARWCGPLLAKGATCTMGCVYEPYLRFTPDIAIFLEGLANHYTFGEAAWTAQLALSWQTTVIGDPLYQPFKAPPAELHARLARAQDPLLEWSFVRLVNLDLSQRVRIPQLEKLLENLPLTARSAVLTEKLADIYELLGKPNSAIDAWQRALTLQPSPQQRVRLRRLLGARLLAAGRRAEAIQNDKQWLVEAPEYAGKAQVEAEVRALTQADTISTNR